MLQIPLSYNRSDTPLYRGGYADVWKGEHQGCHVAVKVLRVYSTSDFDKVTTVGSHIVSESVSWLADLDHVEVLQGSHNMERPSPSKCTVTFGSYNE